MTLVGRSQAEPPDIDNLIRRLRLHFRLEANLFIKQLHFIDFLSDEYLLNPDQCIAL